MQTVFRSEQMSHLVKMAKTAASSAASVFITGENGVGKEHIARILHDEGPRAERPFIAVNCAALPRDLIESELFGSTRGAYTGSVRDRQGLFREADNGTIFLDEIAEMPIEMQSKLLRVLQDRTVRAVGGLQHHPLRCRVIAATNRSITKALSEYKIRADLYYRLAVISLHIPALRERKEDITALAHHFFDKFATEENKTVEVEDSVISLLLQGYWEGNVRQLQNVIHQAVIFAEGKVKPSDFDKSILRSTKVQDSVATSYNLDDVIKETVERAMVQFDGNKKKTSEKLGVSRGTLDIYLKKFALVDKHELAAPTEPVI